MANGKTDITIPDEVVMGRIFTARGKRVMLDTDLAELYGVQTKRLNEQVKRNIKRFPEDFMFQLTEGEKQWLVDNIPHLGKLKYSPSLPFAFTEHGAVMLASVLNSERAIEVNIRIVRIFTHLREMLLTNKDILLKLEQLEKKMIQQDNRADRQEEDIQMIFNTLKELLDAPKPIPEPPREPIGYRMGKK